MTKFMTYLCYKLLKSVVISSNIYDMKDNFYNVYGNLNFVVLSWVGMTQKWNEN